MFSVAKTGALVAAAPANPAGFGTGAGLLQVKVKPQSRTSSLVLQDDGTWLAHLKAPPVDGKANQELIELLAGHFGCRKSAVRVKTGATGRLKLVQIDKS